MIRSGVDLKRQPDGTLQMEKSIFCALESYEVGFHLLPLPKIGQKTETGSTGVSLGMQRVVHGSTTGHILTKEKDEAAEKAKAREESLLPKFLLGRDNVGLDTHSRRLCFNYQVGKCNEAADGAECSRGWHLCARTGCQAPHAEQSHDAKKK